MEVEYEITPDDLFYFQWRAGTRSKFAKRGKRKVYLQFFLCVVALTLLSAFGDDGFDFSRVSFTWLVVFLPLTVVIWWFYERRLNRRAILDLVKQEKPGRGQIGTHKIRFDEAGLVESTVVGESRTSWAGVDRIEQDRDYIFIYTAPTAAHVIPKRAFSSPQEADSFYQFATACKQAS